MLKPTFALLALLPLAACGIAKAPDIPEAKQYESSIQAGGNVYGTFEKARRDGDAAWAKRAEGPPANVRKAIAAYEAADKIDPYDRHVLQQLAKAYYYLANYYSPDAAAKEGNHEKGRQFGERAALLNPKIAELVAKGEPLDQAAAKAATPGDVPGLYWMTVNHARVLENKSLPVRGVNAPKLRTVMEAIYRLGPSYYWGGVHRFFGAYYIKAPAQKDPLEQSKREFERAVQVGKANLENFNLYAEYYAKAAQDRAKYEELLNHVLKSDPAQDDPELRLDNSEARKRAKTLLEKADEDF